MEKSKTAESAPAPDPGPPGQVVLVGNPNVGKSVIFSFLTGRYVTVSNYPGTTVEVATGNAVIGGRRVTIVDTPGTNSLHPMSEDERVTRDLLLGDGEVTVLQVADAKNLRRALFLTTQIAEMGLPQVLCLNMHDEAIQRGIRLGRRALEERLGIPVLVTVATRRKGLGQLAASLAGAVAPAHPVVFTPPLEEALGRMVEILPPGMRGRRGVAMMALAGDETLLPWLRARLDNGAIERLEQIRGEAERRLREPLGLLISRQRLENADRILGEVERRVEARPGREGDLRERLGRLAMHPFWGLPVMAVVLYLVYLLVGKLGAGVIVDLLEEGLFGGLINPWLSSLVLRIFGSGFFFDLLVGPYGVFTMALTYSLAIIFPVVGLFFLAFGLLEDSGYLPRLAVMADRIFRLMGLNGKAVLPMVLGLGCDTMATLTTRILETKKERLLAVFLLALGVPCSAQLGVIMGMLGTLSFAALLTWAGAVCLVLFLTGFVAARILPGRQADFLVELPPIRWPKLYNIAVKTLARVEWYLKEAVPLFLLGTLMLFLFDRLQVLGVLRRAAEPVVTRLVGLPAEATDVFIVGFLRRDFGAAGLYRLQQAGLLDPVQVVVALVTITLFIPCVAHFFVMIKEQGLKTALAIAAFIFPFSFLVGGFFNWVLRWAGVTF